MVAASRAKGYKNVKLHPTFSKVISTDGTVLRKLNRMTKADKWYRLKKLMLAQNWVVYVAAVRIQCFFKKILIAARRSQTRCPISLEDFSDHPTAKRFRHNGVLFFAENLARTLSGGTFLNPVKRTPIDVRSVEKLDKLAPEFKILDVFHDREAVQRAESERLDMLRFLEEECSLILNVMLDAGDGPFNDFLDTMDVRTGEFRVAHRDLKAIDPERAIVTIRSLRDRVTDSDRHYATVVHRECILDFVDSFARPRVAVPRNLWGAPPAYQRFSPMDTDSDSSDATSDATSDASTPPPPPRVPRRLRWGPSPLFIPVPHYPVAIPTLAAPLVRQNLVGAASHPRHPSLPSPMRLHRGSRFAPIHPEPREP